MDWSKGNMHRAQASPYTNPEVSLKGNISAGSRSPRKQFWSTGITGHGLDGVQQRNRVMHLELKSEHIRRQDASHSKAVGWKIENIALLDSQLTERNCHNSVVLLIKKKNASRELWQMKSMSGSWGNCYTALHWSELKLRGWLRSPEFNGIERMWRVQSKSHIIMQWPAKKGCRAWDDLPSKGKALGWFKKHLPWTSEETPHGGWWLLLFCCQEHQKKMGLLKLNKRKSLTPKKVREISLWGTLQRWVSVLFYIIDHCVLPEVRGGRFSVSFLPWPCWWMMTTLDTLRGMLSFCIAPASSWLLYAFLSSQQNISENKGPAKKG